jgi:hypothetical protein
MIEYVKIFRFLVMFLLSLAIPLQGMAAATQIFCHGTGMVSTVSNKTADHSHHQVDDHHHGQTKPSDRQVSKVKVAKNANHKCSTCAQCCSGTALLPAPLILVFNQVASTFVATSKVLLGAISPLNLERPPRSFLA